MFDFFFLQLFAVVAIVMMANNAVQLVRWKKKKTESQCHGTILLYVHIHTYTEHKQSQSPAHFTYVSIENKQKEVATYVWMRTLNAHFHKINQRQILISHAMNNAMRQKKKNTKIAHIVRHKPYMLCIRLTAFIFTSVQCWVLSIHQHGGMCTYS